MMNLNLYNIVKLYDFLFAAIFHSYFKNKALIARLYFTLFFVVFLQSVLITSLLIILFTYSSIYVYSKYISFIIYPVISIINYQIWLKGKRYLSIIEKYSFNEQSLKKLKLLLRLFYLLLFLLFIYSNLVEFSSGYIGIFFKHFWEWY